jgi:hypothetical protein
VEIEMLLTNENVPPGMTQAQANALADRIASVLRERKKFHHKLRGEVREPSERRRKKIDDAYVVMMSCNAAIGR